MTVTLILFFYHLSTCKLGGAERLIINIALCLKRMGHDVRILTSHHDLSHCFEETSKKGKDSLGLEPTTLYS